LCTQDTLGQMDYYQFEEVVTGMVAPSLAVARLGWATSVLLTFKQVRAADPCHPQHTIGGSTAIRDAWLRGAGTMGGLGMRRAALIRQSAPVLAGQRQRLVYAAGAHLWRLADRRGAILSQRLFSQHGGGQRCGEHDLIHPVPWCDLWCSTVGIRAIDSLASWYAVGDFW